ncbi:IS66-like element accessory protein TnpA [Castellaniella caeni]|uniref:IS66-like element accessory protein TnpA n=1 Tax=Castellaniella caeni TaxID=266123 RepID=UPI000A04ADCE|nr:transposase [Castellaniella caeni]
MESDTSTPRPARRRHSAAFKAQILQACGEPGASVSGIAIAHGLNPNMVQRWRREARGGELALPNAPVFVPVVAASQAAVSPRPNTQAATVIEVHLQRGALQAQVSWPVRDAHDCAAWLRELFR